LNERPLMLERKRPFCSSKDSACKGHFRRYKDYKGSIFSNIFVWLVNDIKSFDFGHTRKCPFWSMPLTTFEMLPRPLNSAGVYSIEYACCISVSVKYIAITFYLVTPYVDSKSLKQFIKKP
jgi:hypothetical protein